MILGVSGGSMARSPAIGTFFTVGSGLEVQPSQRPCIRPRLWPAVSSQFGTWLMFNPRIVMLVMHASAEMKLDEVTGVEPL